MGDEPYFTQFYEPHVSDVVGSGLVLERCWVEVES